MHFSNEFEQIFILAALILSSYAYKFVLLDPDDPNLLENARKTIKDPEALKKSIKIAKFRKWLKYDVDCDFLTRPELESRILHGRCPVVLEEKILTTTTSKPKTSFFSKKKRKPVEETEKGLFSHDNKETVVRMVVGNNKMREIDITPESDDEIEIVGGSMITLKCDEANRKNLKNETEPQIIDWFVNGKQVKTSWFDWRVSIAQDGRFGIWPIEEGDSGHFDCSVDGKMRAAISIRVVPMSRALIAGIWNYIYVCLIFGLPIIGIGCFVALQNKSIDEVKVDRMEEFLAEHVFKTDEMAKKRVQDIIDKQNVVDERQMIENRGEGNRSTIRLLLQNPNLVQSEKKLKVALSKKDEKEHIAKDNN